MPQSSRNQRKARKRYYERRRGSKRFSLSEKQKKQFEQFQDRIGLTFENTKLLTQAFTHSSYVNEHRIHSFHDNERLEFLGDAVLELSVSQFLFRKFPAMSEGEMTKLRAAIVCEPSLAKFALELDFGTLVLLGKGEEITGGRSRSALLADAFESFIGALFLDQGIEAVYQFLDHTIFPKVNEGVFSHLMDFKSQLQEYIQRENSGQIQYVIVQERGPAHDREFVSEVQLDGQALGKGAGKSKKEAEQCAAEQALIKLGNG